MGQLSREYRIMDDVLTDVLKVVELFVMVKTDKDKFVFGQINMSVETFDVEYFNPVDSIDVSDVEFSKLVEIDNKDDLVKFFIQFETDLTDFITLKEYEDLSDAKFTEYSLNKLKEVTKYKIMWINEAWSDLITPEIL